MGGILARTGPTIRLVVRLLLHSATGRSQRVTGLYTCSLYKGAVSLLLKKTLQYQCPLPMLIWLAPTIFATRGRALGLRDLGVWQQPGFGPTT